MDQNLNRSGGEEADMRVALLIGCLVLGCGDDDGPSGRSETSDSEDVETDIATLPEVDTATMCYADFPCSYFGYSAKCVGTEIAAMVTVGCDVVCTLPCSGATCLADAPQPCPDGKTCIELVPYQAFCGHPGDTCSDDAHNGCDADAN